VLKRQYTALLNIIREIRKLNTFPGPHFYKQFLALISLHSFLAKIIGDFCLFVSRYTGVVVKSSFM